MQSPPRLRIVFLRPVSVELLCLDIPHVLHGPAGQVPIVRVDWFRGLDRIARFATG